MEDPRLLPRPSTFEPETPWQETWVRGSLGTLGRFQLREVLGEGGVGRVYQAYDPRLDRDVALKVLKQADPGERIMQRFFREARAVARLRHPNIVAVHDAGLDDGRCWIAFEFIKGETLARRLIPPRAGQGIPFPAMIDAVGDGYAAAYVRRIIRKGRLRRPRPPASDA